MRTTFALLAATASVATAGIASATEIDFHVTRFPDLAYASEEPFLRYVRYDLDELTVELTAQDGGPGFGYWDGPDNLEIDDSTDVTPYIEGVGYCGNSNQCTPWVVTFSVAVDAVSANFGGLFDASGSGDRMVSANYFLEAWSGPNGTGDLLANLIGESFDIPYEPRTAVPFYHPETMTAVAPGIRSVVLGSQTLFDRHNDGVHLPNLAGFNLRLTILPEPSSAALLALGLIGLARLHVRRS